jgi:hypothetical protein
MRKIRPLLFCLVLALCALGLGGCTRDNNDGSGEPATSSTENKTTSERPSSTNSNKETNDRDNNTESSSGIMEGIGDNVETMLDDAATMLDPNR